MTAEPANSSSAQPTAPTSAGQDVWTVSRVLDWTVKHLKQHGSPSPRLDAEVLLAHARGCPRIKLYTDFDQPMTDAQRAIMRDLVKRRALSEPVAYLIGQREFYSLKFDVTREVLIPRPDTEVLVMELIERARNSAAPKVLDLGTGSGCISVTAAVNLPQSHVTAVDISPAALGVARANSALHKVEQRMEFLEGDLFAPIEVGRRFDFIVSNPPYIPSGELVELQADVRKHEPQLALDGGPEGLDVIRRMIAELPQYLADQGTFLVEIDPPQSSAVQTLLSETGQFEKISIAKDLAGEERVVIASR